MNGSILVITPGDIIALGFLAFWVIVIGMATAPKMTSAIMVVIVAGIITTKCAHAEPLTVGLHVHSVHVPAKDSDNNANWGLYGRTEGGLTFGGYRNTLNRDSFYIGQTFKVFGPVDMTLGAISGYDSKVKFCMGDNCLDILALAALSVASPVQVMGVTPRLSLVPGHLVKARTVVHFSVEGKF